MTKGKGKGKGKLPPKLVSFHSLSPSDSSDADEFVLKYKAKKSKVLVILSEDEFETNNSNRNSENENKTGLDLLDTTKLPSKPVTSESSDDEEFYRLEYKTFLNELNDFDCNTENENKNKSKANSAENIIKTKKIKRKKGRKRKIEISTKEVPKPKMNKWELMKERKRKRIRFPVEDITKSDNFSSRFEWAVNTVRKYYSKDVYKQYQVREELKLKKRWKIEFKCEEVQSYDISSLKVLDVGSYDNPFAKFTDLDVTAIDLHPANDSVKQCDFLSLKVDHLNAKDWNLSSSINIISAPEKCFDVIIFSLLFEGIPSPEQRLLACEKAYRLLKTNGILCIITHKHPKLNLKTNRYMCHLLKITLGLLGFEVQETEYTISQIIGMTFRKGMCSEGWEKEAEILLDETWIKSGRVLKNIFGIDDDERLRNKIYIPQDVEGKEEIGKELSVVKARKEKENDEQKSKETFDGKSPRCNIKEENEIKEASKHYLDLFLSSLEENIYPLQNNGTNEINTFKDTKNTKVGTANDINQVPGTVNEKSENISRSKWIVNIVRQYYQPKEQQKLKQNQCQPSCQVVCSHDANSLKVLDVGSCDNSFAKFTDLDVTAIDLCPSNESVKKCDFPALIVNSSVLNKKWNSSSSITSAPKLYFDVIIFSQFEKIPSPRQRFFACKKAYWLLKTNGILCIIIPDSKHPIDPNANVFICNLWKITLGYLGFARIKYEKITDNSYFHVMIFRKCDNCSATWAKKAEIDFEKARTRAVRMLKKNFKNLDYDHIRSNIYIPQDFEGSSSTMVCDSKGLNNKHMSTEGNDSSNIEQFGNNPQCKEFEKPNHILFLTVINPTYPINVEVIHRVCKMYGEVIRIVIFRTRGVQALVEFSNIEAAVRAKEGLNGADMYTGCCTLQVAFGKTDKLNVRKNDLNSWDFSMTEDRNGFHSRPTLLGETPLGGRMGHMNSMGYFGVGPRMWQ